ncbi:hypothetical protein B0H12DRAFT_1081888 [Mycena haematopus]|nr:hypothetical protein B0H12DRAFT_1081888 [Mycena haematopus]
MSKAAALGSSDAGPHVTLRIETRNKINSEIAEHMGGRILIPGDSELIRDCYGCHRQLYTVQIPLEATQEVFVGSETLFKGASKRVTVPISYKYLVLLRGEKRKIASHWPEKKGIGSIGVDTPYSQVISSSGSGKCGPSFQRRQSHDHTVGEATRMRKAESQYARRSRNILAANWRRRNVAAFGLEDIEGDLVDNWISNLVLALSNHGVKYLDSGLKSNWYPGIRASKNGGQIDEKLEFEKLDDKRLTAVFTDLADKYMTGSDAASSGFTGAARAPSNPHSTKLEVVVKTAFLFGVLKDTTGPQCFPPKAKALYDIARTQNYKLPSESATIQLYWDYPSRSMPHSTLPYPPSQSNGTRSGPYNGIGSASTPEDTVVPPNARTHTPKSTSYSNDHLPYLAPQARNVDEKWTSLDANVDLAACGEPNKSKVESALLYKQITNKVSPPNAGMNRRLFGG